MRDRSVPFSHVEDADGLISDMICSLIAIMPFWVLKLQRRHRTDIYILVSDLQ
jgi:hypothetical protein